LLFAVFHLMFHPCITSQSCLCINTPIEHICSWYWLIFAYVFAQIASVMIWWSRDRMKSGLLIRALIFVFKGVRGSPIITYHHSSWLAGQWRYGHCLSSLYPSLASFMLWRAPTSRLAARYHPVETKN
jgi:hypothetical protein